MKTLARRELWDAGADQHGYITLRDAQRLGISQPTVAMLAKRGSLVNLAPGGTGLLTSRSHLLVLT